MNKLPPADDEVTPPWLYFNRRRVIRTGVAALSVAATTALYRLFDHPTQIESTAQKIEGLQSATTSEPGTSTATENQLNPTEVVRSGESPLHDQTQTVEQSKPFDPGLAPDERLTPERSIINYNNFYEFTTSKTDVAAMAADFRTEGWQITVDGLVDKPGRFSIDDLHKLSRPEERIYRMRCVEGWSMVVPWAGIELARLLEAVQPQASAKYVAFETLLDPARMPGQKSPILKWPYVEGLRLDEAMHRLTILATGLYGKVMPPQDGAPVRLVVPWKYGFKGIKSIVRIRLTAEEPATSWNLFAPHEYGFYANVNPQVDHPRWSQAHEQRLGEFRRRPTLLFNGYEEQVADLYSGMDLRKFF